MTNQEAISVLESINAKTDYFLINDDARAEAIDMAISALQAQDLQSTCNQLATDCVSRQAAIDEWKNDFKGYVNALNIPRDDYNGIMEYIDELPSAQPERTCVNCGRTANNGGWYADGGTRCPIEEHYALPKDGYCHLWEKRNVTDDDYPERREE